jgi:anaerobic selenocysteine-containing dehydrogenase
MIVLRKPLRGLNKEMNKKKHQTKGACAYKTTCHNCGSGDGNQVYVQEDGSFDAWCYACETYDPMNDGGNVVPINQMKVDSRMKDGRR